MVMCIIACVYSDGILIKTQGGNVKTDQQQEKELGFIKSEMLYPSVNYTGIKVDEAERTLIQWQAAYQGVRKKLEELEVEYNELEATHQATCNRLEQLEQTRKVGAKYVCL